MDIGQSNEICSTNKAVTGLYARLPEHFISNECSKLTESTKIETLFIHQHTEMCVTDTFLWFTECNRKVCFIFSVNFQIPQRNAQTFANKWCRILGSTWRQQCRTGT